MDEKELVWLRGEIKTPPIEKRTQATPKAVIEACKRRLALYRRGEE